jgi:hypothetical protein
MSDRKGRRGGDAAGERTRQRQRISSARSTLGRNLAERSKDAPSKIPEHRPINCSAEVESMQIHEQLFKCFNAPVAPRQGPTTFTRRRSLLWIQ